MEYSVWPISGSDLGASAKHLNMFNFDKVKNNEVQGYLLFIIT